MKKEITELFHDGIPTDEIENAIRLIFLFVASPLSNENVSIYFSSKSFFVSTNPLATIR